MMVQFCVAIQIHIAKKENIQSSNAVSLYLFNHNLSLGSVSSTMEEKMLCVFDFTAVTELILNYIFDKHSIIETATICRKSSMMYLFNSASSKIIVWDNLSI